jgi:hypothetical protein
LYCLPDHTARPRVYSGCSHRLIKPRPGNPADTLAAVNLDTACTAADRGKNQYAVSDVRVVAAVLPDRAEDLAGIEFRVLYVHCELRSVRGSDRYGMNRLAGQQYNRRRFGGSSSAGSGRVAAAQQLLVNETPVSHLLISQKTKNHGCIHRGFYCSPPG